MQKYENFTIKKCRSFGYTFSLIFVLLSTYYLFNNIYFFIFFFVITSLFLLVSVIKPEKLKFLAFHWEKFGFFLGVFFSPIILSMVYVITIIPINIVIRLFRIDLIKQKKSSVKNTYWEENENKKVNFKNQY